MHNLRTNNFSTSCFICCLCHAKTDIDNLIQLTLRFQIKFHFQKKNNCHKIGISSCSAYRVSGSLFPDEIGIQKFWNLWREKNWRTQRKTLGARTKTNVRNRDLCVQCLVQDSNPRQWYQTSPLTNVLSEVFEWDFERKIKLNLLLLSLLLRGMLT